jgi:NAD(P)H-hydrate epimerase
VITPHPGELARLLGTTAEEVEANRLGSARKAVETTGATVVLKGRGSLVARPGGDVSIHAVGNPGMASGGSGDVLTGLLAARLAQGDEPAVAAELAVHLHGAAGDLAAAAGHAPAIPPSVLIDFLPRAFAELERLAGLRDAGDA